MHTYSRSTNKSCYSIYVTVIENPFVPGSKENKPETKAAYGSSNMRKKLLVWSVWIVLFLELNFDIRKCAHTFKRVQVGDRAQGMSQLYVVRSHEWSQHFCGFITVQCMCIYWIRIYYFHAPTETNIAVSLVTKNKTGFLLWVLPSNSHPSINPFAEREERNRNVYILREAPSSEMHKSSLLISQVVTWHWSE